jgi:hypothetical protein
MGEREQGGCFGGVVGEENWGVEGIEMGGYIFYNPRYQRTQNTSISFFPLSYLHRTEPGSRTRGRDFGGITIGVST